MYQFFSLHSGLCSIFIFGAVSLLLQLLVTLSLNSYVKASANMKTTRKKVLVNLKNQFETIYGMDYEIHNTQAYVEKYLLKLKFMGVPYNSLERGPFICAGFVSLLTSGMAFYYYMTKAALQMYIEILFAYVITLVCFFVFFHIFGIKNKKAQIQIQLVDYLENFLANRLIRTKDEERMAEMPQGDSLTDKQREEDDQAVQNVSLERTEEASKELPESDMEMLQRLVREMEEKNSKSKRADVAMTEVALSDDEDPNLELLEEFVQSFLA